MNAKTTGRARTSNPAVKKPAKRTTTGTKSGARKNANVASKAKSNVSNAGVRKAAAPKRRKAAAPKRATAAPKARKTTAARANKAAQAPATARTRTRRAPAMKRSAAEMKSHLPLDFAEN
jgi:hypothetical protein